MLENKDEYNFDKILNVLKIQLTNYSHLTKKLIDVNQLVNNIILETKQYKKQIEEIIEPDNKKEIPDYNIEIEGHYIQIDAELNNIQCNYCNQKAYANNSRGITHFKKHLIAKHNIISN
jgi:predicted patatin/cPLA2 family phospholipase